MSDVKQRLVEIDATLLQQDSVYTDARAHVRWLLDLVKEQAARIEKLERMVELASKFEMDEEALDAALAEYDKLVKEIS